MNAPLPPDEPQRLEALRRCQALDTAPDHALDDITRLAAQICRTPMAMISLVDEQRQWFKARVGVSFQETPRDVAFCAHAILEKDRVMEVSDARTDPRFAANPMVTSELGVRFYAGAPLVSGSGHAIGVLCVLDRAPRHLGAEEEAALRVLGRCAVTQLELHQRVGELEWEIAQRRVSEREYQESQRFLQGTLDALSAHIAILDGAGEIISVNAAWERFARENGRGMSRLSLGANYLEVCERCRGRYSEEAMAVAQGIRAVMAGAADEFRLEYPCHGPQEKRWFVVRVTRFGPENEPCIVVAHENITARKLAEEQLRVSDLAMKAVSQGVLITKPNRSIVSVNDAFVAITGYGKAEILGRSGAFLHGPLTDPSTVESIRACLKNEAEFAGEILNYRKDGTPFWNELTISPVRNESGQLTHFIGVTRDITARRDAEAGLERTRLQLVEASHQAGMAEVATSVLHNVGNVLNSVNVSAGLVAEQARQSPVGDIGRILALLREQGARLGPFFTEDPRGPKLLDFLDQLAEKFARNQTAQLREVGLLQKNVEHIKEIVAAQQSHATVSGLIERVNPIELVEDAIRFNASSFQRHDIRLLREWSTGLPRVFVDKHKALQILVNLLRNATRACDDARRPDKRVAIRITSMATWVRIAVFDNGVGIPPENLARIFNHGFTTKKDGHGFGLHSGANAAKEMGGSLSVESAGQGCGAVFTLDLPVEGRAALEASSPEAPPARLGQAGEFAGTSSNFSA